MSISKLFAAVAVFSLLVFAMSAQASQTIFSDNFNSPPWSAGQLLPGNNGWEDLTYYGGDTGGAGISTNGLGFATTLGVTNVGLGGAAHALPQVYTSGIVTMNAQVFNYDHTTLGGTTILLLGTRNLLWSVSGGSNLHNDAVWLSAQNNANQQALAVYSTATADVAYNPNGDGPMPANWSEVEIGINLSNQTAYVGYYTIDQSTGARTSSLNILDSFTNVQLSSGVGAVGLYVEAASVPSNVDNLQVTYSAVPEPASLAIVASGGLLCLIRRRRLSV